MEEPLEMSPMGDESGRESIRETLALPKADEGKDAWLFLAACFMIEALVWGFPFTFGLFQEYYSAHAPFSSATNIAIIGTCSMVHISSHRGIR
jgi:hypothetical protein